jgi:hypothetical protein
MTTPTYTYVGTTCNGVVEYEPKNYMGTLDRFNIARCARERMTEYVVDTLRWKGERRSFYSSLQMMHTEEVKFND